VAGVRAFDGITRVVWILEAEVLYSICVFFCMAIYQLAGDSKPRALL
jgi:hypothetical protein